MKDQRERGRCIAPRPDGSGLCGRPVPANRRRYHNTSCRLYARNVRRKDPARQRSNADHVRHYRRKHPGWVKIEKVVRQLINRGSKTNLCEHHLRKARLVAYFREITWDPPGEESLISIETPLRTNTPSVAKVMVKRDLVARRVDEDGFAMSPQAGYLALIHPPTRPIDWQTFLGVRERDFTWPATEAHLRLPTLEKLVDRNSKRFSFMKDGAWLLIAFVLPACKKIGEKCSYTILAREEPQASEPSAPNPAAPPVHKG